MPFTYDDIIIDKIDKKVTELPELSQLDSGNAKRSYIYVSLDGRDYKLTAFKLNPYLGKSLQTTAIYDNIAVAINKSSREVTISIVGGGSTLTYSIEGEEYTTTTPVTLSYPKTGITHNKGCYTLILNSSGFSVVYADYINLLRGGAFIPIALLNLDNLNNYLEENYFFVGNSDNEVERLPAASVLVSLGFVISSPENGDTIVYNSTTKKWENKSLEVTASFSEKINFWNGSLNELELDLSKQDLQKIEFTKNVIKVAAGKTFKITKAEIEILDLDVAGTGNNPNGVELGLIATKKNTIVEVNTTSNYVKIAGDLTAYFTASQSFDILGSTGNNGSYTVSSSSFDGTNTQINTNESISDATADGSTFIEKIITTAYKQLNTGAGLQATDLTTYIDANLDFFKDGDRIAPYINVAKRAGSDATEGGTFYLYLEEA